MKIIVLSLFIFLSLFCFQTKAQTYGNEWITYSQKYYQFQIVQTGIYRIDHTQLANAGIPLNTFSSANIQVFGREKEIPLFIVDGSDNSIDSGDYILFYAEKNDGWLDSTLYPNPDKIGNPAYSLYNDTINYFFTWNSSITNKRFIEETDINFGAYTPSSFINWNYIEEYHGSYFEGEGSSDISTSFFNDLEGFSGGAIAGPNSYNYNVPTGSVYTGPGAPMASLQINAFGSNNAANTSGGIYNHHLQYTIGPSDSLLLDTLFQGIRGIQFNTLLNPGSLANGSTLLKWKNVGDLPVASDRQGWTYFSLTFPRTPVLSGFQTKKFNIPNQSGQSKIRLDLTWSAANPILFSFGDVPRKLNGVHNGSSTVQVLLPNNASGIDQTIAYADATNILSVNLLKPVNATGNFRDFSIVTPDSALLMVYHKSLESGAIDYKNYRNSISGGGHQVIMAEVDELYLQFGGGIPKHVNGVRRFSNYLYNLSVRKPTALFLVGKGIREAVVFTTNSGGAGTRANSVIYAQSLIPSFGQPSSDIALTASLIPNNLIPLIPTGRISVRNNAELLSYLDKVIEQESQIDSTSVYNSNTKDWQKHILHFAGGITASEQADFQMFLGGMQNSIEKEKFGGKVTQIYKQNSDPLDPATYNQISARLSSGVSLINFFGHANAGTVGFEINIDEPSNWNNQGKYPLVIANTCYNGNIFHNENTGFSTSEKFVRAQNSGAIGYLSTVSLGFSGPLNVYSQGLYDQLSKFGYGNHIGKQIQDNIDSIANNVGFGGLLMETTVLQMTYNGDPLIKVNPHVKPEIELLDQSVSFGPTKIDLTVDSIFVNIELKNLGQSITDTFLLQITRDFPETGVDSIYQILIPELHYTRTVQLKMPLQPNIGIGLNQFTITADIPSFIPEVYDEFNNNKIVKNLFINIQGIQPIAPYKFAVVPKDSVVLKASTIDPLANLNTYIFEIDTTDLFNSPFKRYQNIMQVGGVKEAFPENWQFSSNNQSAPLICTDSTVYFWRVALSQTTLEWKESSFQYIESKVGWGQDHFFQFKDNGFAQLDYDRPNRKLHFTTADTSYLECLVYGTNIQTYQNQWLINATLQDYDLCGLTPSIHVGVVDPISFESWGTRWLSALGDTVNPTHGFGNANDLNQCRNRVEKYFIYRQNSASQLAAFQNMVLNEVPNGHYLIIYAPRTGAQYSLWNALDSVGMYSTFAALGSDSINGNRANNPMAFFVQKGNPSSVIELFGQTANDPVHLTAPMVGSDYIGQETSTLIGPAANWNSFYWKVDREETLIGDTTYFTIDRYDGNQNFQSSQTIPVASTDSILFLQNYINAQITPYMKLNATFIDSLNFTPGQLDRWHVLYDPIPEAAIDGTNGYYWTADNGPVNEGESISFSIDVRNISDIPMDSLLIHYYIEDENHVKHIMNYPRQDSLRVNQVLRDTFTFSTTGFPGSNIFWMEVNPYSGPFGQLDQPEQFHFNNLLQIPFNVNRDDKNPILDVTFDGRHILNGDIVNPFSEILITLKDDNPLLIMDNVTDTSLFGVYLTNPKGIQKRIPFEANGQTVMQWIPADAQNKRFKIMYPGSFDLDGKYTLLVQGSDKSGNISGDLDYRITFEVIRESTITKLMNYPNPFSTSTRFVFTLTGSEVPDDMIIQIMTVSGKVIREITEGEFGPIYIGRNISQFSWNGTDEFGDQLANGVYLYRVRMKIYGEDIKQRESGADQYFTKEFGKMYLLR
jgi:hypothetical protein